MIIKHGSQVQNNQIPREMTLSKWMLELYHPNAKYYLETFRIIRMHLVSTKNLGNILAVAGCKCFPTVGETRKPSNKWLIFADRP